MTICNHENCNKSARYNIVNTKAKYCSLHKLEGMVDVVHKKCLYEGCKLYPSFNFSMESIPIYCFEHKHEGMERKYYKKCIYENCNKQAGYNVPENKEKIYCFEHKLPNMVRCYKTTCMNEECNLSPSFNYPEKTKRLYCSSHKLDGMIMLSEKYCEFPSCKTRARYNFEGTKPKYCVKHKENGMINLTAKLCIYENCKTRPTYNYEGLKEIYCNKHKLEGMINTKDKKCIYENCNTIPIYNYLGETKKLYCSLHKNDGMINVKDKTCLTQSCPIVVIRNKYDGYCFRCWIYLHPNEKIARNYKTKEIAVVEYVKTKYPEFSWICDKMIPDGCSKRRPDLLLDMGYQIIIIEVDENQHVDYDTSCENKRIMEISRDVEHRPIIFIRFNPDDYKSGKINCTSCWGTNKNSLCVVKKNKKNEWNSRLEELSRNIEYWINNKTDKMIETINLFYDV